MGNSARTRLILTYYMHEFISSQVKVMLSHMYVCVSVNCCIDVIISDLDKNQDSYVVHVDSLIRSTDIGTQSKVSYHEDDRELPYYEVINF